MTTAIAIDDDAEDLAGAIEFPLQRRGLVGRLLQQSGNAAHLGAHAGGGHDRLAVPVGGRRATEDHVVAIAKRHIVVQSAPCPWSTGRLSPVRAASAVWSAADSISRASAGMVSPSSIRMMSPGTMSAAGMLRRSPSRMTVASSRRHRAKRSDGRLRSRLLDVPHGRVQQDDGEDGDGLVGQGGIAFERPEAGRNRGGDEQQDDEHILELREEPPPRRDCPFAASSLARTARVATARRPRVRPRWPSLPSAAMTSSTRWR